MTDAEKAHPVELSEADLDGFADRLAAFAATLNHDDRVTLNAMLLRAMDPMERMHWRNRSELLSPAEDATLRQLLDTFRSA
jgi:hypothetical protein